jgi:hypothetical protein
LHLFILENGKNFQKCFIFLKNKVIFVSLPVIYWTLRALFWPGSREYHAITSRKIDGFMKFLFLCLIIVFLSVLIYWKSRGGRKKSALLFQFGLIALFLGYAPYVFFGLVGNGFDVPITYFIVLLGRSDWYSRHQILQSLGFSLVLVGLIGLLPRMLIKFASPLVATVLIISVIFNVLFGFEYVVDYQKQSQIVADLKISGQSSERNEIQIIDQTVFLNARQRSYRERDWLGLIGLADGVNPNKGLKVSGDCSKNPNTRLVLIQGPRTHWEALKNWVSDGDMGFKVTVDDSPGACKPEMVTSEKVSGAIPILFYFTGAKD